jgi:tight adherence protein B
MSAIVTVLFGAALALRQGWLLLPAMPVVGFEYYLVRRRVFQRAELFERDYPAFLLSLASGVRTGLDPLVALSSASEIFPEDSLIREETERIGRAIDRGDTEEKILADFGAAIDHPDISMFRAGFLLARRQGSSLGECLQRLARVTRQRQSFRRKIRSAVAMQKLSAFGIVLCTLTIGVIQALTNPSAIRGAWAHPVGNKALSAGCFLVLLGFCWMLRITRSRV